MGTRPIRSCKFLESMLRTNGPEFLYTEFDAFISNNFCKHIDLCTISDAELKSSTVRSTFVCDVKIDIIGKLSSFYRLIRVFCYVYHFVNHKLSNDYPSIHISNEEFNNAYLKVLLLVQEKLSCFVITIFG